ncbi:MAG: hypothetical protein WCP33_07050 [Deltaproteobacteria bacterium]
MDKQQLAEKATETLRPFETANILDTIQHLSLTQIFSNPVVMIVIAAVLFFGIIKRSMAVLMTLVMLIGLIVILRYAMPSPGEELSFSSLLPFIGCGLLIGGVIIYFSFVKHD